MRSGVPMKNSSILPRKEFDEQLGDSYPIPRRFAVMEPLESDQLHDITIAAYKSTRLYISRYKCKKIHKFCMTNVYGWIKKILILAK